MLLKLYDHTVCYNYHFFFLPIIPLIILQYLLSYLVRRKVYISMSIHIWIMRNLELICKLRTKIKNNSGAVTTPSIDQKTHDYPTWLRSTKPQDVDSKFFFTLPYSCYVYISVHPLNSLSPKEKNSKIDQTINIMFKPSNVLN